MFSTNLKKIAALVVVLIFIFQTSFAATLNYSTIEDIMDVLNDLGVARFIMKNGQIMITNK